MAQKRNEMHLRGARAIKERLQMLRSVALPTLGMLFWALALPVAAQTGASTSVTDLSSQHDPRVSAAKRMQGQGAVPRGPAGPPAGFRGPVTPRVVNPQVAPRFQGPRAPVVSPGYRAPVVRPPVGVVAPAFRGPAVGFRGPYWRGGRAAFIRGRHHVRRGGLLLPLVGLGALGAIYVGSRQYTPYAYVDSPEGGQCAGPTDDGVCELRMTEVPLESGGAEMQCVAYCPPQ